MFRGFLQCLEVPLRHTGPLPTSLGLPWWGIQAWFSHLWQWTWPGLISSSLAQDLRPMSKDVHLKAGGRTCYLSTEWWKTSLMVEFSSRRMGELGRALMNAQWIVTANQFCAQKILGFTLEAEPALHSTWQGNVGVTKLYLAVPWHEVDHNHDLIALLLLSKAIYTQANLGQKICHGAIQ